MNTLFQNEKRKSKPGGSFIWMLLPLVTFTLITIAIMVERSGFKSQGVESVFERLPAQDTEVIPLPKSGSRCLIITDGINSDDLEIDELMDNLLLGAKIACDIALPSDLNNELIASYDQFIITFYSLDLLNNHINEIFDRVSAGGGIFFTIRPDPDLTFQAIYRKLGITNKADRLSTVSGIDFERELLIGANNVDSDFSGFIHSSIPVELDSAANVYIRSADHYRLPLVWDINLGRGKVVVINSDQFANPESTGILFAAYGLLQDYFIYPVINSLTFYLDQFPGPLTPAQNQTILNEFGRDNRSFYINVWWPDVLSAGNKYKIVYTGLIVQSFTETPQYPYQQEGDEEDYEFLSASLIHNNGEVALLGYSLMPYCAELTSQNSSDLENIGLLSAIAYAKHLAAGSGHHISTLSPSDSANCFNVKSLTGLSESLDTLVIRNDQAISGLDVGFLYHENESGLITLPMDNAGYNLSEIEIWRTLNLATTKFAFSGSINPYDVTNLNSSGWTSLRSDFEDQLLWTRSTYPHIRATTASDASNATQRFSRIDYQHHLDGNTLSVSTAYFYDEAWFILHIGTSPKGITGGEMLKIGENRYLIKVTEPVISIELENEL